MDLIRPVNDQFAVAPQLLPAHMAALAAAGYRSVINNRPDGEEYGQPSNAEMRAAAEAAGLTYHEQPVISGGVTLNDAERFGTLLNELPSPLLAFCRSGTRCIQLWALSQAGKTPADTIIGCAARAGYDLSPMRPYLEG